MLPQRNRLQEMRAFSSADVALAEPAHPWCGAKVLLAGKLTATISPGGGEIQLRETTKALQGLGVDAEFWRPWEQNFAHYDLLHLFGSHQEYLPLVRQAQQRGIKVVLSPITWFDLRSCWGESRCLQRRVLETAKYTVRRCFPRLPSWRRELYQAVDLLLPNSNVEAQQLMRHFQVPPYRLWNVPNGASSRFAHPRAVLPDVLQSLGKFILYPGRIEPRKNQLAFLKAMQGSSLPIVILGDPVPGYEWYYQQCLEAARGVVRFVSAVDHDDPHLEGFYQACGCVVLCSWYETPGLVALEAAMSGVPLVLPTLSSGREYFGPLASYVYPGNPKSIRSAVTAAYHRGRDPVLAELVRERFTWEFVAKQTMLAYERVLD